MVYFIIAFYIPGWFCIKQHSICTQGAKNFFKLISLARNLSPECRNIVYSVLQNNRYWAHVENILLAAIFDEEINRGIVVKKILDVRKLSMENISLRIFRIPIINFSADNYLLMVDWNSVDPTSPPLLQNLSEQDILNAIEIPLNNIYQYPCHTQPVERIVQLVSQVSSTICGHDERHG